MTGLNKMNPKNSRILKSSSCWSSHFKPLTLTFLIHEDKIYKTYPLYPIDQRQIITIKFQNYIFFGRDTVISGQYSRPRGVGALELDCVQNSTPL